MEFSEMIRRVEEKYEEVSRALREAKREIEDLNQQIMDHETEIDDLGNLREAFEILIEHKPALTSFVKKQLIDLGVDPMSLREEKR